jgi:uncharacterized protein YacL
MNITLSFIRSFFVLLSILFMTAYTTTALTGGFNLFNLLIGILIGGGLAGAIIAFETSFNKLNLRTFNIATIGLFFGFLLGHAVFLILSTILDLSHLNLSSESVGFLRGAVYLFASYLGLILTVKASEELYLSIPFVKLKAIAQKKKDILLDPISLSDPRIVDLASSGLLDQQLVIPRFAVKELTAQQESADEPTKNRARRSIEVLKRLEATPGLELRYSEKDYPDLKDNNSKLIRLARETDANIMTADLNKIQQSTIESLEGIRIININFLSNALKPLSQTGEQINIKIQRYGKEPRQGVGYLDDGTMVVVNGGAEYIGETIKAQVLSVKHTSSGRMIFCNAPDEPAMPFDKDFASVSVEHSLKNYFGG